MSKIRSKLMRYSASLLQFDSSSWTEHVMRVMHGTSTFAKKKKMFSQMMYPVTRTFFVSVLLKSSRSTFSSDTLYRDWNYIIEASRSHSKHCSITAFT